MNDEPSTGWLGQSVVGICLVVLLPVAVPIAVSRNYRNVASRLSFLPGIRPHGGASAALATLGYLVGIVALASGASVALQTAGTESSVANHGTVANVTAQTPTPEPALTTEPSATERVPRTSTTSTTVTKTSSRPQTASPNATILERTSDIASKYNVSVTNTAVVGNTGYIYVNATSGTYPDMFADYGISNAHLNTATNLSTQRFDKIAYLVGSYAAAYEEDGATAPRKVVIRITGENVTSAVTIRTKLIRQFVNESVTESTLWSQTISTYRKTNGPTVAEFRNMTVLEKTELLAENHNLSVTKTDINGTTGHLYLNSTASRRVRMFDDVEKLVRLHEQAHEYHSGTVPNKVEIHPTWSNITARLTVKREWVTNDSVERPVQKTIATFHETTKTSSEYFARQVVLRSERHGHTITNYTLTNDTLTIWWQSDANNQTKRVHDVWSIFQIYMGEVQVHNGPEPTKFVVYTKGPDRKITSRMYLKLWWVTQYLEGDWTIEKLIKKINATVVDFS